MGRRDWLVSTLSDDPQVHRIRESDKHPDELHLRMSDGAECIVTIRQIADGISDYYERHRIAGTDSGD